jgi:nitrite reductase/ring-hydroxylating ferredoxin subunit
MSSGSPTRFPFPVPTGWFAVAWSDDVAAGGVRALRTFDRDLVLFRGQDGAAHVLDAHCPHLGAHLGGGRVEGDVLVCPFHAWRWDGDGRCAGIPYAKRVPPTAKLRAWLLVEHAGAILVWHDPAGGAPAFEVPPFAELCDPDWTLVERHEFTIATAVQEIGENAHDPAHFATVHGVPALPENSARFEGPRQLSENRGKFETPRGPVETSICGTSHGLGVGHLRTRGLAEMAQLLLNTPIDEGHVHVRWQFAVPKRADGSPTPVGVAFAREFVRQFRQDIPIWEAKAYLPRPILCDGDGQIAAYRRWASQFYAAPLAPRIQRR